MNNNLDQIILECWNLIAQSDNHNERQPQYITVCNHTADYINAYTVVLREANADAYKIIFYTDVRSNKVNEISSDGRLTIVSYNDESKVQMVLKGIAIVHHQNEISRYHWQKSGYKGRRSYIAQPAPSSVIAQPADGLAYLNGKQFDESDETGIENFSVIEVAINQLEFLQLNRDGNRRAKFTLKNNEWKGSWLIP